MLYGEIILLASKNASISFYYFKKIQINTAASNPEVFPFIFS